MMWIILIYPSSLYTLIFFCLVFLLVFILPAPICYSNCLRVINLPATRLYSMCGDNKRKKSLYLEPQKILSSHQYFIGISTLIKAFIEYTPLKEYHWSSWSHFTYLTAGFYHVSWFREYLIKMNLLNIKQIDFKWQLNYCLCSPSMGHVYSYSLSGSAISHNNLFSFTILWCFKYLLSITFDIYFNKHVCINVFLDTS